MPYRYFCAAFFLLAGFSLPAYSQEGQPAPVQGEQPAPEAAPAKPESKPAAKPEAKPAKPQAAKPEQNITTTAFGDWNLRCEKGGAAHMCEISQIIESTDQSGPIAKISVGKPSPREPLHVVVILPNNVSFPSSVHIRTDENDKWGFELAWLRCIPGGCFADAELNDATLAHWHGLSTMGSIVFRNAAGDEISLPMTFRGFGDALDALKKS